MSSVTVVEALVTFQKLATLCESNNYIVETFLCCSLQLLKHNTNVFKTLHFVDGME